jgi:hypothetical protein
MLISTFELLVKRQLPSEVLIGGVLTSLPTLPLSRPLVQGYFLSISNITATDVSLVLNFKSVTSPNSLDTITATVLDQNGANQIGDVIPDVPNAYKYPFILTKETTALFILQPDIITQPNALTDQNIEQRGYADIEIDPASPAGTTVELLITPEHRGTFYRSGITDKTPEDERQLGEVAYTLTTASGGSYFKLQR